MRLKHIFFGNAPAAVAALLVSTSLSYAEGPFAGLSGSWSGGGHVRLANGQQESLRCRAYYNQKAGGTALSMAVRCASPSQKIEMRASLSSSGHGVSGTWEERSYNAAGNVSGKATASHMNLAISGGVSGSLSVTTSGSSQSIRISAQGTGFTGITLKLSRS